MTPSALHFTVNTSTKHCINTNFHLLFAIKVTKQCKEKQTQKQTEKKQNCVVYTITNSSFPLSVDQSLKYLELWYPLLLSLSCIGEGNGNPLQCSCLEYPREGGAWWAAVYGVTQSWTRLKWLSSLAASPSPQSR